MRRLKRDRNWPSINTISMVQPSTLQKDNHLISIKGAIFNQFSIRSGSQFTFAGFELRDLMTVFLQLH